MENHQQPRQDVLVWGYHPTPEHPFDRTLEQATEAELDALELYWLGKDDDIRQSLLLVQIAAERLARLPPHA